MRPAYGAGRLARNLVAAGLVSITPVAAEPITIAALGDSLTQGYGLPPEQGLVPQLQAWLDAAGAEAVVLNAGVSGDTTAGGLSRIGWTLTPDVDALIVALGGNDVLRGIDPAESRGNLSGILDAARQAGLPVLLVGIPVPANYGPDYQEQFRAIWPDLAAEYGTLLLPDLLAPIAARLGAGAPPASLMQPDGIHPAAAGVALVTEALGPKVLELIDRAQGR